MCKCVRLGVLIVAGAIALVPSGHVGASPGYTERVSVDSAGNEGNGASGSGKISADGRFVAFTSGASNLVPGDTNGWGDVFVHDRLTWQTARVSVDSLGNQGNISPSGYVAISDDGRYVAFSSFASNLVPDDTNDAEDIFLHDMQTGETTRVSVSSGGGQADFHSSDHAISADGRYVAFESAASNLVPGNPFGWNIYVHDRQTGETTPVSVDLLGRLSGGSGHPSISPDGRYVSFDSTNSWLVDRDLNGVQDVFVRDLATGETTLVSVDSAGNQGNGASNYTAVSSDGRFVAFASVATNLVEGDTNGERDVFVHDSQTGETTRVSVDSAGNQASGGGGGGSLSPAISADGRYVVFYSYAPNLVPSDSNGARDVFVHDRQTGETSRVSVDSLGNQANQGGESPDISADGLRVAFSSYASNLVPGDWNGARDIFVHDSTPPVGGIAELPHVSGSSGPPYGAITAGFAAVALLAGLTGGAWYARRRWLR